MDENLNRCDWCLGSEIEKNYHDYEWGVAVYADDRLFESLCLEGAQAGLSWRTILKKRDAYRRAFDDFSIKSLQSYDPHKIEALLENEGIVRHRQKINSVFQNAKAATKIIGTYGSLSNFFWNFVDGQPVVNSYERLEQLPSKNDISTAMSKELKKIGFSFVGPTTCYSFMQACGMVNDHLVSCFRYQEILSSSS